MKLFYELKDQPGELSCLDEEEAHSQISKLRGPQPESRSKFKEIFDRARANRLPRH